MLAAVRVIVRGPTMGQPEGMCHFATVGRCARDEMACADGLPHRCLGFTLTLVQRSGATMAGVDSESWIGSTAEMLVAFGVPSFGLLIYLGIYLVSLLIHWLQGAAP
jgi:hypothetical protein